MNIFLILLRRQELLYVHADLFQHLLTCHLPLQLVRAQARGPTPPCYEVLDEHELVLEVGWRLASIQVHIFVQRYLR